MLFTIFTLRPDGSTWQHRGEIEAPQKQNAEYLAKQMMKSIDGVARQVVVCGPGDTFPVGPSPSGELINKHTPVPVPDPITRGQGKYQQPIEDNFRFPKPTPLGRVPKEKQHQALAQDDKSRDTLSELFSESGQAEQPIYSAVSFSMEDHSECDRCFKTGELTLVMDVRLCPSCKREADNGIKKRPGKCHACGRSSQFLTRHHKVFKAVQKNSEKVDLCAKCHREFHHLVDRRVQELLGQVVDYCLSEFQAFCKTKSSTAKSIDNNGSLCTHTS